MSVNFEHPSIDWDAPDLYQEFRRFREHVNFVLAGPLSQCTQKSQAGWIGTWIGAQGREVFRTLEWEDKEEEKPASILDKFETYVRPSKNKRIARHKLKSLKQLQSESFAKFLTRLRLLIMDCAFHDADDMLIDAIIDGVYDTKLQERLLDKGEDITLAKAIEICQQFDASKSQIKIVRNEEAIVPINVIKKPSFTSDKMCGRCGGKHKDRRCPAAGTTCAYCKKTGHWAKVCYRNKTNSAPANNNNSVNKISEEEEENDILSLFVLGVQEEGGKVEPDIEDKWLVNLKVNGVTVPVRIDTGAKCNTITTDIWQTLPNAKIQNSQKRLKSYSNHIIKPIGTTKLQISNKGIVVSSVPFEVVDLGQDSVISGEVAESLNLIHKISQISESQKLMSEYPNLVETTGVLPGEYQIKLKEGAKGVIHAPRRTPLALKEKVINKLKQMKAEGQIKQVKKPTEWVNSMTVVAKGDKVRICLDPQDLNRQIQREHYPMKTVEQIVSEIPNAKIFSTLDAKSGFLQIKLTEESSYLTTFNTPIGRYRWLRLPFGVSCAPEVFQRIMEEMLEGITGAFAVIDDILIAGENVEEHDKILSKVLKKACDYNLRLNFDKVKIRQTEVAYVGHVISQDGLKPDPEKVKAVLDMPCPTSKQSLKRFLGFVTYLSKFLPHLSTSTESLRRLLKEDVIFEWNLPQEQAFQEIKLLCTKCPILKFYDVTKPITIQSDASSTGLGAVLLQEGRPVAYSSRAMTETETRYAQIEKELLSIVFACKQFHCYIFGKPTLVLNDHKPLETIFKKPLYTCPLRLQRMLLFLQWYDLEVRYERGSNMTLADTLSRAYTDPPVPENISETDIPINFVVAITEERESQLRADTECELKVLKQIIMSGWPEDKSQIPVEALPYWKHRAELTIVDGFILKGNQIVIPPSSRKHLLYLIHSTHLGIVKCKQRAREVVYWPNMSKEIEELIFNCEGCAMFQKQQSNQPLNPLPVPDVPFERISLDYFEFEGEIYLLCVDNYSKFIIVYPINNLTASTTIKTVKHIISSHGIPVIIITDSGSQFTSEEFKKFCTNFMITLHIVSPQYQRANGMAERAIQTIKKLWRKGSDKHLAILDYNSTPLEGIKLSPAQLLMSRRPRNMLPAIKDTLRPMSMNNKEVINHFQEEKLKQKRYHDKLPNKILAPLCPGQEVRVAPLPGHKEWFPAVVTDRLENRTYRVKDNSSNRNYVRNRVHIRTASKIANQTSNENRRQVEHTWEDEDNNEGMPDVPPVILPVKETMNYTTRSGRTVRPPVRLDL